MFHDQSNIFNVPHSLPSSAHPIALATRTPTGLVKVESTKFIPDYGGSLEIPGTKSKQYCLRRGVPFHLRPAYIQLVGSGLGGSQKKTDDSASLVVASYLDDGPNSTISIIRAIQSTLYFNAVRDIPHRYSISPVVLESNTYSHIPYPYPIIGLKYSDTLNKFLIVKFAQGVKLLRLNPSYRLSEVYRSPESSDTEDEDVSNDRISISDNAVVDFFGSVPEQRGLHLVDACLTTNQGTLAMASGDNKNFHIKLYDVNSQAKIAYKTIVKIRDDNAQIVTQQSCPATRRRSQRSFVSICQPHEELQQIECDPSHLVQLALTTSNRVSLVDIRADSIQHDFVDKLRLASVLPAEQFSQMVFSKKSDRQFYLLSNEHVRAFDKRFLSQPMAILQHMHDPEAYKSMKMKLIGHEQSDIETLCISCRGRLCFLSFDQSERCQMLVESSERVLNPSSLHAPLHEPSPAELIGSSSELYGMDVSTGDVFEDVDTLFSVFQLSNEGDMYVRGYFKPTEELQTIEWSSQAKIILERHKNNSQRVDRCEPTIDNDTEYTRTGRVIPEIPDEERLNVLDASSIMCAGDQLTSKRALAKFDRMKKKLYKY